MTIAYGGQVTGTALAGSQGLTYDGSTPALVALTAAELAELEANYPPQAGLTQDQWNAWLIGAYNQRHWTDGDNAATEQQ